MVIRSGDDPFSLFSRSTGATSDMDKRGYISDLAIKGSPTSLLVQQSCKNTKTDILDEQFVSNVRDNNRSCINFGDICIIYYVIFECSENLIAFYSLSTQLVTW